MLVYDWLAGASARWPSFTVKEMTCQCGCGALPDPEFMDELQALRFVCGFPFPVTSGARCPAHNNRVSSTKFTGPHTTGLAVDIGVSREKAWELNEWAAKQGGWYGRGVNGRGAARFVHLDRILPDSDSNNPRPRLWSY